MKIYLSSTKGDLEPYRDAVLKAIRRLEHEGLAMEDYTSASQAPLDKCLEDVMKCDLYVGIFAHRYGFIPPGQKKSITELEYRKAKECHIPTLIFLVHPKCLWDPEAIDDGEAKACLKALKQELENEIMRDFFTSPDDLATKATAAISKEVARLGGAARTPAHKPWEIPPCTRDFSDRKAETKNLVEAMQSGTSPIAVIHGLPGTGKSELARLVADRLRDVVPDGGLYYDLHGNEEMANNRPTADAVMRHVILRMDPKLTVAGDPATIAGLYHSVLKGGKVLLLLDNAYDLAQVQSLIPPQPSLLIVTSRKALRLPGCLPVALEPFVNEDAAAFLRCLHQQVVGHEETIARLCGNLPLALRLAAAALENAPHLTVEKYVARLADAAERHRYLKDVDAAIDVTCELLDPKMRDCFYALCVFAEGCECEEAARIWDMAEREAEEVVGKLREFNLLKWNPARRVFEMHDLIRDYARMKLTPTNQVVFRVRHAELASALADRAKVLFKASGERAEAGLALWDAKSKDIFQALSWTAGRLADDTHACELAADIAESSWFLFEVRYALEARLMLAAIGVQASRRLEDKRRRSVHIRRQAFLLIQAKQFTEAASLLTEALEVSRLVGDREGEGIAAGYLGSAFIGQSRIEEGIAKLQESLAIAEERKDTRQIGISLGRLADAYVNLGDNQEALAYCQRAIAIETQIDDIAGLAIDHTKAGGILGVMNNMEAAVAEYEMAATAQRRLGNATEELRLLIHLASVYAQLKRTDMGEKCSNRIVAIVETSFSNTVDTMSSVYGLLAECGLWPVAVRLADAIITRYPDRYLGWVRKASAVRHVEAVGGLPAAVEVLVEGRKNFPKEDIFAYDLACYTALLGDLDGAMKWLGEASELSGSKEEIRDEAAKDEDLKALWGRLTSW
jgi:tetratricopeptide (TPR) repeat protein